MSHRVGIIGYGAIATDVLARLATQMPDAALSVLAKPGRDAAARDMLKSAGLPDQARVTTDLSAFLSDRPHVVAECAGHRAVCDYAEPVLEAGADLVIASVGALSDEALYTRLQAAAERSPAQLVIPSGAIGGLDVLGAARLSGLDDVAYIGRKPPAAWRGSQADQNGDLDALTQPTPIFEGSAREAAQAYPKNANVAATLALAGLGMDRTRVTLIADPEVTENIHEFSLRAAAVEASLRLVGKPSPRNPKTSLTTALSIARAVMNRSAAIAI